jgi:hypothetical protein
MSCANGVSVGVSAVSLSTSVRRPRSSVGHLDRMGVLPELLTVRTCRTDAALGVLDWAVRRDVGLSMCSDLAFGEVSELEDCARFNVELRVGPRVADVAMLAATRGMRELDVAEVGLRGLMLVAEPLMIEESVTEEASSACDRGPGELVSTVSFGLLVIPLPTVAALAGTCVVRDFGPVCASSLSAHNPR